MIYLLDTTLLIDVVTGAPGSRQILEELLAEPNTLLTCDVVVAEALSRGDDIEVQDVRNLIDVLEYVATHPDAAAWAVDRRRAAGRTSPRTLGDALIAGIAWFSQATVVTRNPDDFVAQGIPVLTYG